MISEFDHELHSRPSGRHRLRPPRPELVRSSEVSKPGYRLDGSDIGRIVTFVPLRWIDTAMTGELRQIHMSADEIQIAVLQTAQQKGAYPMFESSGMDDAPHFVDYAIGWEAEVTVRDS